MKRAIIFGTVLLFTLSSLFAEDVHQTDTFTVDGSSIGITFLGHASLIIKFDGLVVHVDPVSGEADYTKLPKADLILITHQHSDHLDKRAIASVEKETTSIVLNKSVYDSLKKGTVIRNGEKTDILGLKIEAVPAYNTTPGRERYHPKDRDNGYIITFKGFRIYIAGDTEDTPEMRLLEDIDVAFLPMNQPYTMTPEQAAGAARTIRPAVLYPYHYGSTDTGILMVLLKNEEDIEVRIR